jgi:hypothetical protein
MIAPIATCCLPPVPQDRPRVGAGSVRARTFSEDLKRCVKNPQRNGSHRVETVEFTSAPAVLSLPGIRNA